MTVNFSPCVFLLFLILSAAPFLFEKSFAQENQIISPKHQWKLFVDLDGLKCKEGLILLQKSNGFPACVTPSTFLKLIDRGYGKFDSSQLMNRPDMMTNLMSGMIDSSQLMHHWHTMILNDPKIMQQTMSNFVLQLKENSEFMTNIMSPMITIPELREQMIEHMKNHNQMMISFQDHPGWMDSVHQPIMGSNMGQGMTSGWYEKGECSWCPEIKQNSLYHHSGFHQPKIMEDMMHHIWINEKMRNQMHELMLGNIGHMGFMINEIMEPLIELMMNDPELRDQMIEMMLEHQGFMDSIRHENKFFN
ncbi:MAG: hypothetical protein OEQ12_00990 [Nitrosopumilus sp.]|nr:hypothetical protein [Nitrosopumilus sp.]